ncbi:DUF4097 family beta strand repeat-containing protein [Nocardioides sp. zg-1228]|uniref:DUF4097 family beta strand repeat-containing protein n=1 Tax=Nocardioides sp. zg-1228 TaxID=2763008 RepID=UPI001642672B|nr:DUF4097 family beta strand repeat-containing protein [Nocardioides sp. zg-1228]MBC2931846.1 DUF4097 family beta strand repeat protein [Nocardioides sp. zg-1228]QSF57415.1 DUF4097 family beta strand repeat protein [Nocardioides sp. zg-1228]
MRNQIDLTFDTPEPIDLHVENARGLVRVSATATARTTVSIIGERAEEFDVHHVEAGERSAISIVPPRSSGGLFGRDARAEIVVELPTASRLRAKVGSSDLVAEGRLDDTRVDSGSGDVSLDVVEGDVVVQSGSGDLHAGHLLGDAHLRSGSGDIVVRRAESALVVTTGSGDVRVDSADGLAVKTGSGDAHVQSLGGEAVFTTGSGDLVVAQVASGRVTAKTASGDVRIGVDDGTPVWTDVRTASGRLTSMLPSTGEPAPDQPYLEVRATTASGDVTLHPS